MTRPRIIDCFPINDELDMLECRLTELYDAVDFFVAVEADVTHQDGPKPYHVTENLERFAPFKDKLVVIRAFGLPTLADNPDPWAREHAQREWIGAGLDKIVANADDVVMQSDVDEIPKALLARNLRPAGLVAFEQRLYCFALDWFHPVPWRGTVAGRAATIAKLGDRPFGFMRDSRNVAPCPSYLKDGGWHFSWFGGQAAAKKKLGSFCHPEIADRVADGLEDDVFLRHGFHVDGTKMVPVNVDGTYPKWVREGKAPASWYRPR